MTTRVEHNEAKQRYELRLNEELVGVLDYRIDDGRAILPHTEILPAYRGRGYGDQLVQAALDDLRASSRKIVPRCWFVADFVREHQEYADLIG